MGFGRFRRGRAFSFLASFLRFGLLRFGFDKVIVDVGEAVHCHVIFFQRKVRRFGNQGRQFLDGKRGTGRLALADAAAVFPGDPVVKAVGLPFSENDNHFVFSFFYNFVGVDGSGCHAVQQSVVCERSAGQHGANFGKQQKFFDELRSTRRFSRVFVVGVQLAVRSSHFVLNRAVPSDVGGRIQTFQCNSGKNLSAN